MSTTNEKAPGVRERIAADAARHYDERISNFFEEALVSEKVAWADCPKCRHRVKLNVPDWGSRVRALELLLNQGFGRPSNEAETPTVIHVHRPEPANADQLIAAGWTPPPGSA